jgi:hypothetical protein
MTSENIVNFELDIGLGTLFSGQYNTFNFLFEGGYFYYAAIFPDYMTIVDNKQKIREQFHILVYDPKSGIRLADDSENGAPLCRFSITEGESLNLNVAVSRDIRPSNMSNEEIPYKVKVFGYDLNTYNEIGEKVINISFPEVFWFD